MHYVLLYDVAEDYLERRGAFRAEHLSMARAALDRGDLLVAGALAEPADQAMLVFRIPGAAEAFAGEDPYVRNGLVKSWKVRKWNVVVGDGAVT
jgi:uncharacterized protein YciI